MYFKVFLDGQIVDALDNLQCVFYLPSIKRILRCTEKDSPEGIISTDGQYIWQVDGWPQFPEVVMEEVSGTVVLYEIDAEEYGTLRALLDEGKQPVDPEPEPDPPQEIDKDTLEWAKKHKIAVSKTQLANYLEAHPIISKAHGNVAGTYSVTEEKQQLMALNYTTYQIKKAAGIEAVLTWNETGEECKEWTEAEYVQLIVEIESYVKPLVSKQQFYEKKIQEATTIQEVDAVEITY